MKRLKMVARQPGLVVRLRPLAACLYHAVVLPSHNRRDT